MLMGKQVVCLLCKCDWIRCIGRTVTGSFVPSGLWMTCKKNVQDDAGVTRHSEGQSPEESS